MTVAVRRVLVCPNGHMRDADHISGSGETLCPDCAQDGDDHIMRSATALLSFNMGQKRPTSEQDRVERYSTWVCPECGHNPEFGVNSACPKCDGLVLMEWVVVVREDALGTAEARQHTDEDRLRNRIIDDTYTGECVCRGTHYATGMAGTEGVSSTGAPIGPDCHPQTWREKAEASSENVIARRREGRQEYLRAESAQARVVQLEAELEAARARAEDQIRRKRETRNHLVQARKALEEIARHPCDNNDTGDEPECPELETDPCSSCVARSALTEGESDG